VAPSKDSKHDLIQTGTAVDEPQATPQYRRSAVGGNNSEVGQNGQDLSDMPRISDGSRRSTRTVAKCQFDL
jgi:hypothetical protein